MKKALLILLAVTVFGANSFAQEVMGTKRTPLSQEELQERALEAASGTEVERAVSSVARMTGLHMTAMARGHLVYSKIPVMQETLRMTIQWESILEFLSLNKL